MGMQCGLGGTVMSFICQVLFIMLQPDVRLRSCYSHDKILKLWVGASISTFVRPSGCLQNKNRKIAPKLR